MNEQDVFLAAIDIADLDQRGKYIERVCGNDFTLRKSVGELLIAHEESGEFLKVPAIEQLAPDAEDSGATLDEDSGPKLFDDSINLSFLESSSQPGSLGRLSHYEMKRVLGRGGFGIVFEAFDTRLCRVVAIKVMLPELSLTSPARKRFLGEARAMAAIRHQNVISVYAVEESPLPFLVMEFIEGESLQQRIERIGPLEIRDVVDIATQISRGLNAAHTRGLVHRDIKPANILLEQATGVVKLTDFGLARSADDASLTLSGFICGTPLYMSPEQALGKTVDQKSDLFSLGSVMYVMCSGRPPFRAPSTVAVLKRVVDDQPRDIRELVPDVPRWLIGIIVRLHAKAPEHRPNDAKKVDELLTLGESGFIVQDTKPWRRVPKIVPWYIALALPLLLAALLFVPNNPFFSFSNNKPLSEELPGEKLMSIEDPSAQEAVAQKQYVFLGHENATVGVLFSSDEKNIVSASNGDHHEVRGGVRYHVTGTDNSIRLWEIESGKEIRRLRMTHGHGYGPISMCRSPKSETIAIASGWIFANGPSEPSIYIWKTNSNVLHQHFALPTNHAIRAINITPDGSQVRTTTSGKGLVHNWALATGKPLPDVELKDLPFRVEAPRMSWSEDGRYVLSAQWGGAGDTLAWDASTGEIVKRFQGHTKPPSQVVMAPGGRRVVTCADDFTIRIWDWDSAAELVCIGDDEILESGIRCVACSPDGNQFMAGSADGMLILYSLSSGDEFARFSGHTGAINDVTFSASGRFVASASDDKSVRIWEMPNAE